jgi:hypothetical protein
MGWKKVVESKDLIVLEKSQKGRKIKIEARKNDESAWEIFKTQVKGDASSLISECVVEDKKEMKQILEKLKKEISSNVSSSKNPIRLSLKRKYKEDFVEKWVFFIGKDKIKNIMIVKLDNVIDADIVLHEKYKPNERKIVSLIEDQLGLKELGDVINYEIFYFKRETKLRETSSPEYNMDIDIEFRPGDEEI